MSINENCTVSPRRAAAGLRALLGTATLAMTVGAGLAAPRANAVDIEVFFSEVELEAAGRPKILFILDTSTSMFTVESATSGEPYSPAQKYTGPCENDKYYFREPGTLGLPDCASAASLTAAQFDCPTLRGAVDTLGEKTFAAKIAQRVGNKWQDISDISQVTACRNDTSQSGINWNPIKTAGYTFYSGNYLNKRSQDQVEDKYRIDAVRDVVGRLIETTDGIDVGLMRYGYDGARVFVDPAAQVCEVLADSDESTQSSNGAPIMYPVKPLEANGLPDFEGATVRDQLLFELGYDGGKIASWQIDRNVPQAGQSQRLIYDKNDPLGTSKCPIPAFSPGGRSPIGGAMEEAFRYWSGMEWTNKFGKQVSLGSGYEYPSVAASRKSSNPEEYESPIQPLPDGECLGQNFIILLSDGTTEQDNDGDQVRADMMGLKECDTEDYLNQPPGSMCVNDFAKYMANNDLVPGLDGSTVITHTVGFKLSDDALGTSGRKLLQKTANDGGGNFYEAQSVDQLYDVLSKIFRDILTRNTSFTSPTVSVNAFNRTQNLNQLYMSLFSPSYTYRWKGNLKKYQIGANPQDTAKFGRVLDVDGDIAVDVQDGFFLDSARSFWTYGADPDGKNVPKGGAAQQLEAWASRKVYSNLQGDSNLSLTSSANALSALKGAGYAATAPGMLGIEAGDTVNPTVTGSPELTASLLVDWLYGRDVADYDGDGSTTDSRQDMGDPLHSRPVTAIYGGSVDSPDINDALVLVTTNDGFLHAFDPVTGDEAWSFIPETLLGRARDLYYDDEIDWRERVYGLDGSIRLVRIDNNNNGIIETADEPGKRDKIYAFFGQRRGGSSYFALDISEKDSPRLMWQRSYAADGAGQSWSRPVYGKVRIDTTDYEVLVFGGGYDTGQDVLAYSEDDEGRGIYIVNALNGDLLWRAGPTASGADLTFSEMTHSFPADLRAADLTGDGFLDRIYASDMGGRIWRFDILNGKPATSSTEGKRLVEGGIIASLGNAEDSTKAPANTLRFFYSPDPALMTVNGITFINIAIGSGHRELPASDTVTQDWFFSVRDYFPNTVLLKSQYKTSCANEKAPCHQIVTEDDLKDLTNTITEDVPVSPASQYQGWRIRLETTGEKALAEAQTFQSSVFFTTYAPTETGYNSKSCTPVYGDTKLYVVSALDAKPVNNYDESTGENASVSDRVLDLSQGSIAPEAVFIFPTPDNPNAPAPPPVCLIGLESCGAGLLNPPVRTYWRQRGAN